MSISKNLKVATVEQIKERVLNSRSGIAVFADNEKLKSCFADTIDCIKAIKNRDVNYLFTLHKQLSIYEVNDRLTRAVKALKLGVDA